jgi:hypothetical protein
MIVSTWVFKAPLSTPSRQPGVYKLYGLNNMRCSSVYSSVPFTNVLKRPCGKSNSSYRCMQFLQHNSKLLAHSTTFWSYFKAQSILPALIFYIFSGQKLLHWQSSVCQRIFSPSATIVPDILSKLACSGVAKPPSSAARKQFRLEEQIPDDQCPHRQKKMTNVLLMLNLTCLTFLGHEEDGLFHWEVSKFS